MITINYQQFGNKGFQLRLKLYQSGETKFINVTKLLKGPIQKKHWNARKQMFIPSCPYSDENNAMLVQFRQKYDEMAINWTGSVFGMVAAMGQSIADSKKGLSVSEFIQSISDELWERKHADGTRKGTFEGYDKLNRRFVEYCKLKNIKHERFLITEMTSEFVDGWLKWLVTVRKGVGLAYISKTLHAVIMRADKAGHLKADDFKNCNWHRKSKGSIQKNRTLTEEQCKKFASMDLDEVIKSKMNDLYRDFCLFILYTGQSVCDAVALRYCDIQQIGGIHTYTFRHTAITRYISKGVPVIYVANMMGTSVDNCEKIYYNNQADVSSRNKVLAAMGV